VQYRVKNHGDWGIKTGELGRHSKVIEEEIIIRLHSDLK
jgi:hypothetical protein